MNRGARRESVFAEAWVIQLFLSILAELPARFRVKILAYAIMPNHYHLLLECLDGNLSAVMQYLGAQFTQRLNAQRQWDGPVFRGRFKSRLVEDDAYLTHLFAYIHTNPVRAGIAASVDSARWTSHRSLIGKGKRPAWLSPDRFEASFPTLAVYRGYLREGLAPEATPAGWDPEQLWVAPKAAKKEKVLAVAANPATMLSQLATVTGAPVEQIVQSQRGRQGNPLRVLAAWWLVRAGRLGNKAAAAAIGCEPARISQMLTRAGTLSRLLDPLDDLVPPADTAEGLA
jgi:REP element-mobilizing transposase RayT